MTTEELKSAMGEAMSEVIKTTMPAMVKESVESFMKDAGFGVDKINRKNILDPNDAGEGNGDEDPSKLTGSAKIQKFINAVATKNRDLIGKVHAKALTEGTTTAGGFLVPDEFSAELLRIAEDFGLVRKYARRIPMSSDTRNIPRLTTSVVVYWPGENTAGTISDPVFGNAQLLAKTCIGLTVISNELLEDSDPEISGILMELFGEAISGEEDKQGLVGSGAPFTGIMGDSNVTVVTMVSGKTTFSSITVDNLREMIAQVKVMALGGAGFIMHRTVWSIVQLLREASVLIAVTANPNITQNGTNGTGIVGYIWGYPVYLSDRMPYTTAISTKFIIFGNLKYLLLGDRKQITFSTSDSATVGTDKVFEQNASAVRVTERIALTVGLPTAFVCLKTAAS